MKKMLAAVEAHPDAEHNCSHRSHRSSHSHSVHLSVRPMSCESTIKSSLLDCDECGEQHPFDEFGYIISTNRREANKDEEEGVTTLTHSNLPVCMDPPPGVTLPSVWTRMPNTAFGIPLGLGGQALMWNAADDLFSNIDTATISAVFWVLGLLTFLAIATAYIYKIYTRLYLVRAEVNSPGRIHFMNAPHLVLLTLAASIPDKLLGYHFFGQSRKTSLMVIWGLGFLLQVSISQFVYERWIFSKTKNIVSAARPQFLMSIVGWFVLASFGQEIGLDSVGGLPVTAYCFGIGIVLYFVALIAVINRLHLLPQAKGSPVLTLLLAPPSVGVLVLDDFDKNPSQFSTAAAALLGWCLVIFALLIKFGPRIAEKPPSLGAYWAYVFPLASMASAALRNADMNSGTGTMLLSSCFVGISSIAVIAVAARTSLHIYLTIFSDAEWGDPLLVMNLIREKDTMIGR